MGEVVLAVLTVLGAVFGVISIAQGIGSSRSGLNTERGMLEALRQQLLKALNHPVGATMVKYNAPLNCFDVYSVRIADLPNHVMKGERALLRMKPNETASNQWGQWWVEYYEWSWATLSKNYGTSLNQIRNKNAANRPQSPVEYADCWKIVPEKCGLVPASVLYAQLRNRGIVM